MPEHLTDADSKRLEFLQSDLSSMKQEIATRSGMQERAKALYFGSLAILLGGFAEIDYSMMVACTWASSWLAITFWTRESLEIKRLSERIKAAVITPAASILACEASDLAPSECDAASPEIDPLTKSLHDNFMWVSFFWIPVVISTALLWMSARYLDDVLDARHPAALLLIAAFVAARATFKRLQGTRTKQRR